MGMNTHKHSQQGFSILEALVGGALVTILAVTLFPAFYTMIYKSAAASFRVTCNSLVRAKLQQYVSGAGAHTSGTTGLIPTGFEFARFRYRATPACDPNPANSTTPGFRENTSNTGVLADNAPTESSLPSALKGFQLWVNIRHYNPRGTTPKLECPSTDYQFNGIGDAIEVSVTGMIRTEPPVAQGGRGGGGAAAGTAAGDNARYGGLRDLNYSTTPTPNPELTCSASQLIYPPKIPFRYWLGSDGKIRNLQSNAQLSGGVGIQLQSIAGTEAHFRSIWSSDPTTGSVSTPPIAGIEAFSVSPDNSAVYILKAGTLLKYEGCTDRTVTVNDGTTNISFYGMPDCDPAPTKSWSIIGGGGGTAAPDDSFGGLKSIAVDFGDLADLNDDIVYGLKSAGPVDDITAGANVLVSFSPSGVAKFAPTDRYTLTNMTRARGIMISQTFPKVTKPTLYIIDNTCYFGPSQDTTLSTSYCVSVFNASDSSLLRSVTDLPLQAEGVSN